MSNPESTSDATVVYTAVATSVGGGRQGQVSSESGRLDLALTPPQETGGPGTGTNPEELFAAGWSACFASALSSMARRARVDASQSRVTARIGLQKQDGGFGLVAALEVSIPGVDLEQVQELADQAHEVCPYSKATRGNIAVSVTAV